MYGLCLDVLVIKYAQMNIIMIERKTREADFCITEALMW